MLRFLTDEQISPAVGEQVQAKRPEISIASVHHWRAGVFRGKPDSALVAAASQDGLTLVTYDRRTIPNLLVEMWRTGADHSGVVFVDEDTITSADIGGLVRTIVRFYDRSNDWNWTNRIGFLDAAES